jgi:hypothetical protein
MIIYYTKHGKFETLDILDISFEDLHSVDDNTPSYYCDSSNDKCFSQNGLFHRLNGPAQIFGNIQNRFWLNGIYYESIHDWLNDHPNQTNAFQVEMLLKWS